ncbi:hypothetical protein Vretimale_16499 [Volvox reticuliferus]|uniref:Acyl-[acyl-carrier-protein] desaturase n=1 Tax=Volvox reticuliferus TaxID=1737510 RepID=A0A8J4FYV8_9CHLO|nr:hypothetical protein Vretifemale_17575 [Volvox reticuliferus]GIM13445.1 hypothetical protein Vretimale_16499 [Volvox reticuliferus]
MLGASRWAQPAAAPQQTSPSAAMRLTAWTLRRPFQKTSPCPVTHDGNHTYARANLVHASSSGGSSSSSNAQTGLSPTAGRNLSGASAGPASRPAGLILPPGFRSAPMIATAAATSTEIVASAAYSSAPEASPPAGYRGHGLDGPIIWLGNQRVHSLSERGRDVMRSMSNWAAKELPRYLKSAERSWQPADLLPDSASPDFYDQVSALRAASANLPNDYLVVLVGDMVTEEALPSYMNMLNTLDETRDETGASDTPWAHWTRHWTAEENRHGDVLNKYLYLSGRVDMHSVESTIQRLIGRGLDPKLENNPYLCFVYTSFQERATRISHGNTARLAQYHGDVPLAKLTGLIASDEARHEAAYTAIVAEIFERDPDGAMLAFADMMRKGIVMPAHFVDDDWHTQANGKGTNLFVDYAAVADAIGVYTTNDYANIVDHLVKRWDIGNVKVVTGEAAEAQAFLIKHSERIRRLADLQMERRMRDRKRGKGRTAAFSWIFKREVALG